MKYAHAWYTAAGVLAAGVVAGIASQGSFRRACVEATAAGMRVSEVVNAELQNILDEASDISAEARQKAKFDAAVRARLSALEPDIRKELAREFGVETDDAQASVNA